MPRRSARFAAINPRRSARLAAAERQQQQQPPSQQPTKRVKSSQPSLNDRLATVFSWDEAIPLNEYLASIPIVEDGPRFLFNWDINTFTDDFVAKLARVAGGRCGRVLLAPNNLSEFGNVAGWVLVLQEGNFMQHVAQLAFNNAHRLLATTFNLTTTKAQDCTQNNLLPLNGRRLFE